MIGSIKRTVLAATLVAGITICGIQQAQATRTMYVGKYPTYAYCATAAQTAKNLDSSATGWECVYNTYSHFWDAYLILP